MRVYAKNMLDCEDLLGYSAVNYQDSTVITCDQNEDTKKYQVLISRKNGDLIQKHENLTKKDASTILNKMELYFN